jgi:hypothetical protein
MNFKSYGGRIAFMYVQQSERRGCIKLAQNPNVKGMSDTVEKTLWKTEIMLSTPRYEKLTYELVGDGMDIPYY